MAKESNLSVLQINKLYDPWIGGVEQHVKDLSEGLANNHNVDVTVLCVSEDSLKKSEMKGSVKIIKVTNHIYSFIKKTVIFSMPINFFFPCYLKRNQKQILHFHLPNPLAVVSYLLVKPKGKVVVMWHSDIIKQKFFLFFYRIFLLRFLKKADIILTTSPQMISNSSFISKYKDKCKVLHLGIEPQEYLLGEDEILEVNKYNGSKEDLDLLFVGRLSYYKGIFVLIKAMQGIDANLTIIGDGSLKQSITDLIDELGLSHKVKILPSQSRRELVKWFHKCDFFVLPSIAPSEAFGIVQLEAMICGKPVISTNLPTGVPYVNQHGVTGEVVEPNNVEDLRLAIIKLLKDANLREIYGRNGFNRVIESFTKQNMVKQVMKTYKEIL